MEGTKVNAKAVAFFSGFPEKQFTESIADELKMILNERKCLVFISAWPDRYVQNDDDAFGMNNMFTEKDMAFEQYCVIDERTDPASSKMEIEKASCIFLMGGNATAQMKLIKDKGIFELLKRSKAVILGVSAGSMNMGNPVADIYESVVPYEGLGFANLTIKSHFPLTDENLQNMTRKVSMEVPVTLMKDESAIFMYNGVIKQIGEIYRMEKGEIKPILKDDLKKIM
ncbi:MAG: Type 1 glutamine amidotransferase-like domain-containing protein [Clostridia bacterium]|nr:Type 1 glutamine amidotransferase-like domain-containing protein [Clostridia bacterium]